MILLNREDAVHFGALSWENWKNKATFITEPKKVFIVKVPLFLQFEHV